MVAQNWIRALNTRLSETPNIGGKVGYGALIVSTGALVAAGYVIYGVCKGTVFLATSMLSNLWNAKPEDFGTQPEQISDEWDSQESKFYDHNTVNYYHPDYDPRLTGWDHE